MGELLDIYRTITAVFTCTVAKHGVELYMNLGDEETT